MSRGNLPYRHWAHGSLLYGKQMTKFAIVKIACVPYEDAYPSLLCYPYAV